MGINGVVQDHFTDLLTSGGRKEWGQVLDCIHPSISEETNSYPSRPITIQEIMEAAFQIGGLKAPGPDGFQGIFYQSFWNIISNDAHGLVEDFADGRMNPRKLNSTHIVLIPKSANLTLVGQFKPISLFNHSYKKFRSFWQIN